MREIDVAIGMVCRDGKVLICQRRTPDPLGGYWEFPGGKVEPGESADECLLRELAEEVAIRVRITAALDAIEYDYESTRVRLHPFACELIDGEPQPLASQRLAWVSPTEFSTYRFPPANDSLLHWLAVLLAPNPAQS